MLNYELKLGTCVLYVIWIDSIYNINMLYGRNGINGQTETLNIDEVFGARVY